MGARQTCHKACANCAAACTRPARGGDELDDERPGGDPAGATFEETLEDLNSLDRHLMLFCATSNLSAVRWLLFLGAHPDSYDANGTTCLHVACRSGALSIVREVMKEKKLLHAVDTAGWTPLHIAVLMGRTEVVIDLLAAGAPLHQRNGKGQVPSELCADSCTFEAIRSFEFHLRSSPAVPWTFSRDNAASEDAVGSRLQYEPFFVPRQPVIRSQQYKKEFQKIGMQMFNWQPGYGLAFLVASGVARDYPVDMSTFLRRSKVDTRQVGSFLGEAYSLSHTIRLEFINSVVLQNTGVTSAPVQVFQLMQLPDDLQKINRLVHGVARIWWRQHERLTKEAASSGASGAPTPRKDNKASGQRAYADELTGIDLKQYLTSSDALHQLMFSTVMLHWYIYKDGTGPRRDMDFAKWKKLNEGLEAGSTDIPEHVQQQIHNLVSRTFIPELAVATANNRNRGDAAGGGPDDAGGNGPGDANSANISDRPRSPVLSSVASLEAWAQLVGGGFPKPAGVAGSQTVSYRHMSNIFSEVTNSAMISESPVGIAGESALSSGPGREARQAYEALPSSRREDFAWISLCFTLLFFSASPTTGAPYAFVDLRRTALAQVQTEARILTIIGTPEPEEADVAAAGAGKVSTNSSAGNGVGAGTDHGSKVVIVLLLPDGRWQELPLPKLELRVPSASELNFWSSHLASACQGTPQKVATSLKKS